MDRRQLDRRIADWEAEIARIRRQGDVKTVDVVQLAESLGRERRSGYGDEPTYRSTVFRLNMLTIPGHRRLIRKTALNILRQLETEDLAEWKKLRGAEGNGEHDDDDDDDAP